MTFEEFKNIIQEMFPEVTSSQMEQFRLMDELYRDWNSKINVVSRKDIDELYRHHVMHSLFIAAYIRTEMPDIYDRLRGEGPYSVAEPLKIMDLGTGGGFPGIPLAVMFPHAQFTLCDSIGKKIRVVEGVCEAVGIKNIRTVNGRVEQLKEQFDYIVSRAVTDMPTFVGWVRGMVRKGAKGSCPNGILYLKGGDLTEELRASRRKWVRHDISGFFEEEFFKDKKVVYVPIG